MDFYSCKLIYFFAKYIITGLCLRQRSRNPDPSVKVNSDRVNLVAPASPIKGLLYFPSARAIQYKLGPERLTRLLSH